MSKKCFKNRSSSPQNIEVDSDSESFLTPELEQEELEEEEDTAADDLSLLDRLHNGGLPHVLKDGGKGRKHSAAPSSSAGDGMGTSIPDSPLRRALLSTLQGAPPVRGGRPPAKPRGTRGRRRGRAVAVTSSEVEATWSPVHESRVDEPQIDEPSTHETRVPEASFQATPEQSNDEGTSQETQWDTWAEPSGHAGSDEELGEGATFYQRGSSGLPLVSATPEQRWSIRPNGDKGWIIAKGVHMPNNVLGVLCRKNFPGFVTLPGRVREVGMTWEHYLGASAPPEVEIDGLLCDTRADMVIRKFWTYYMREEGYEEDAAKVIETECRHLLQNFRHEARVQAVRDYYAMRRIRIDKAKCRDAKMEKEHYMKVRHNKTEVPQMYDLYEMAHTASYKKVKAFSESDLEHRENFTNITSHHKLVKYRDHGKARKGEDFNPSEGPIDPELVMIAGNGRPHASIAIGDGLIRCPSTLWQIKARQTSSCPEITRRPWPVELAIEAAIQKERDAMQAAMAEKDKAIRELEERTTALVEAERARNDASNRAIYELFVSMCEKNGQVPSPMPVINVAGTVSFISVQ
ncbi:hypothetical protein ZWY2020_020144 [Hordeum vulgare]|nr:hypothetical protein ZWY2020_020144 [Hordeum vulgare]